MMKKIPCLFQRDFTDRRHPILLRVVTPGCEWVLDGEGIATRKFDGTACAVIQGVFHTRYDAKNGKKPPIGSVPCDAPDPTTGHWPHWVVADRPEDRWAREAFDNLLVTSRLPIADGTYEACGPKIGGNPERFSIHLLVRHGSVSLSAPRDFDGLREFLTVNLIEGIVFHRTPDGQMVKIRRDDFDLPWPVERPDP